ncbi:response regulator transcription factor [Hymenobacter sp.]|uniref:response regulator transcription factor n=1 Tax=Hymenobacter sp. TaxID=1898978 RepID=UPI002EDB45C2
MPCRLLILDDHLMLIQGLSRLLDEQTDLQVVGQFNSGEALLAELPATNPAPADLLLLDLHLPGVDGLTLLPRLRQQWPGMRVLVFSTASTMELLERLEAAGASGFVPKSADASQLLMGIRIVYAGKRFFPHDHLPTAPPPPPDSPRQLLHQLSPREREIVGLVREGLTTREMANHLHLSEFTVSTHRRNIMHKLQLHNVAALVQFAHKHGLS